VYNEYWHKDRNLKKEPWDSSTEKTKTLLLDNFGVASEVLEAAKPKRSAKNRREAVRIRREMSKKGVLTNKTGVKARISGKAVGKIVSNQAINTPFSPEVHYLAAANLDYLFINSLGLCDFELNPSKNNDGLKERHYLYSTLEYESSIVIEKITVKEYINDRLKNNLYLIEVIDTRA
jgi:hypothetical protein